MYQLKNFCFFLSFEFNIFYIDVKLLKEIRKK